MATFIAFCILIWFATLPLRLITRRNRQRAAAPAVQVVVVQPGAAGAVQIPQAPEAPQGGPFAPGFLGLNRRGASARPNPRNWEAPQQSVN